MKIQELINKGIKRLNEKNIRDSVLKARILLRICSKEEQNVLDCKSRRRSGRKRRKIIYAIHTRNNTR